MDEFSLIRTWFDQPQLQLHNQHILLGNGDDCSLLSIPDNYTLAQSMDTLVADVHFPGNAPAYFIGYRSLMVCLSDLAAMGATPHSFFLALTLPEINETWLSEFSRGLAEAAGKYQLTLTGGDTTRGPLTISCLVQGMLPKGKALYRKGAKTGDRIFVSNTLGDAGGALPQVLAGQLPAQTVPADETKKAEDALLRSYYLPQPQIILGQWLVKHGATAAIDISDGLLADLNHILKASNRGAYINSDKVPISNALNLLYEKEKAIELALTGGDDYQLCFCWPQDLVLPESCPCSITEIGAITADITTIIDRQGRDYMQSGYNHFLSSGK